MSLKRKPASLIQQEQGQNKRRSEHLDDLKTLFPLEVALLPKEEEGDPVVVNMNLLCHASQEMAQFLAMNTPERRAVGIPMKDYSRESLKLLAEFVTTDASPRIKPEEKALALEVRTLAKGYSMRRLAYATKEALVIHKTEEVVLFLRHLTKQKDAWLEEMVYEFFRTQTASQLIEIRITTAAYKPVFMAIHHKLMTSIDGEILGLFSVCPFYRRSFFQNHQNARIGSMGTLLDVISYVDKFGFNEHVYKTINLLHEVLNEVKFDKDATCEDCQERSDSEEE